MPRIETPDALTGVDYWLFTLHTRLGDGLGRDPSVRQLAEYAGRSASTCHTILRRLAAHGLLVHDEGSGRFKRPGRSRRRR